MKNFVANVTVKVLIIFRVGAKQFSGRQNNFQEGKTIFRKAKQFRGAKCLLKRPKTPNIIVSLMTKA